jgi:hypothetical protein
MPQIFLIHAIKKGYDCEEVTVTGGMLRQLAPARELPVWCKAAGHTREYAQTAAA